MAPMGPDSLVIHTHTERDTEVKTNKELLSLVEYTCNPRRLAWEDDALETSLELHSETT